MLFSFPYNRRCLSVCLSVCLLATLRNNFLTDLHEILRESWQWATEQLVEFWWWSGSLPGFRVFRICHYLEIPTVVNGHSFILIRQMAALVRRALAKVCTVPVLLVSDVMIFIATVPIKQRLTCHVTDIKNFRSCHRSLAIKLKVRTHSRNDYRVHGPWRRALCTDLKRVDVLYLRGSGRPYSTSMVVGATAELCSSPTTSACVIDVVFLPLTATIASPTSSASHLQPWRHRDVTPIRHIQLRDG